MPRSVRVLEQPQTEGSSPHVAIARKRGHSSYKKAVNTIDIDGTSECLPAELLGEITSQ